MLSDTAYMARAMAHAQRGRGRTSPNPMVGAVLVDRDGVVVGQGFHSRAGEPHAEVHALREARDSARGATLYCTLEPCCHHGRTGPCAPEIVAAGVRRVVAAAEDPNPLVAGGGFRYLQAHGVGLEVGVGREWSERLNRPFFTFIRRRRPFVLLKAATSLDGRIAAAPGVTTRLTAQAADRRVHATRAEVDALAIGSGTLLADDPVLTVRGPFRERPLIRIVFDRRLRTPPSARLFSTLSTGPVIILTTSASVRTAASRVRALEEAGARVEAVDDPSLAAAMARLGELEITWLLLEGGAGLHAAAWKAGLVDQVQLYIAPVMLGPGGVPLLPGTTFSTLGLVGRRVEPCGEDMLVEGDVHGID